MASFEASAAHYFPGAAKIGSFRDLLRVGVRLGALTVPYLFENMGL